MTRVIKNRVFEKRKELDLTQEELAQKLGITRQTVIAIERGNYTPSIALALDLAKFFRCKVEEIFW